MKFHVILAFLAWIIVCIGGSAYGSFTFLSPVLFHFDGRLFTESRAWWLDTEFVALCGMAGLELIRRYLNKEWPFETEVEEP